MLRRAVHLLCSLVILAAPAGANAVYDVTIGTSGLIGSPAGPFVLDVQFIDGSGTGDANNTAILSAFNFGSGSPAGSTFTFGGVTGDLSSSVEMIDSSFFNEFTENFNPGNTLSFQLNLTTNADCCGAPDEFSLAILDSSGFEIPTLGPANALLIADIDPGGPAVSTFATDTSQSPPAGGPPIDIAAPTATSVSGVPEPAYLPLLALIAAGLAITRRSGFRRQE